MEGCTGRRERAKRAARSSSPRSRSRCWRPATSRSTRQTAWLQAATRCPRRGWRRRRATLASPGSRRAPPATKQSTAGVNGAHQRGMHCAHACCPTRRALRTAGGARALREHCGGGGEGGRTLTLPGLSHTKVSAPMLRRSCSATALGVAVRREGERSRRGGDAEGAGEGEDLTGGKGSWPPRREAAGAPCGMRAPTGTSSGLPSRSERTHAQPCSQRTRSERRQHKHEHEREQSPLDRRACAL